MRALVTGGSGYIGSRLLAALAARPDVDEVVDVDLRPPPAGIPKVRFAARSVTEDLADLFRGADLAMHLAWTVDPLRDARRQREICIGGTRRFLEACGAAGVRHLFFMSSATAYGAHPAHAQPLDESAPLRDRHHFQYSAEKREAEGMFRRFAGERPGVLLQMARPVVVAGPNVENFIVRSMRKRVTLRPLGRSPAIQLVHEDDCAAALAAVVASGRAGAFNVAAPGEVGLREALGRLGTPAVPVPVPVMWAAAAAAWRLGLAAVAEAPPGFVFFVAHPWRVSSRRLEEEVGFRYRHDAPATFETYLAARNGARRADGPAAR